MGAATTAPPVTGAAASAGPGPVSQDTWMKEMIEKFGQKPKPQLPQVHRRVSDSESDDSESETKTDAAMGAIHKKPMPQTHTHLPTSDSEDDHENEDSSGEDRGDADCPGWDISQPDEDVDPDFDL